MENKETTCTPCEQNFERKVNELVKEGEAPDAEQRAKKEAEVKAAAAKGGFDIEGIRIVNPATYEGMDEMVAKMVELRKGKMSEEECRACTFVVRAPLRLMAAGFRAESDGRIAAISGK